MVLILASMTVDIVECFNTEYQADHMTADRRNTVRTQNERETAG